MSELVAVQANISGYMGKPCTLLSVYDPDSGLLSVRKIATFRTSRIEGCLVVALDSRGECDCLLSPDIFGEAVQAYLDLKNSNAGALLKYESGTNRAAPSNAIELGDFSEAGAKVRIDAGVSNEQMAVVASCWAARSQTAVRDCFVMFDKLAALHSGRAFTI